MNSHCSDCNNSKRITLLTSIVDCERCKPKLIPEIKTYTDTLLQSNREELRKELLLIKARQTKLKEQNKEKIEKWKLENLSGNGYDEIRTVGLNIGTTFSTGEWSSLGEWSAPLQQLERKH